MMKSRMKKIPHQLRKMIILKTNQNILQLQRLREIDSQYRFELDSIGMVLVKGIKDKGDIKNNPPLEEAFNLGKCLI